MKNLLLAIFLVLYCSDASQACDWFRQYSPVPVIYHAQPAPQVQVPVIVYYPVQFVPVVYSVPIAVQPVFPLVVPVVPTVQIVPPNQPMWIPYRY